MSDEVLPGAIDRYRQTLTEMAEFGGDHGFVSSTRRWDRLVDRLRQDEPVVCASGEGREAVAALLADPRPTVRLWAATAALSWDEEQARPVLVELRENPTRYGLNSISAKHTLLEFDPGRPDPPAPC
jgi:hypothetical protein